MNTNCPDCGVPEGFLHKKDCPQRGFDISAELAEEIEAEWPKAFGTPAADDAVRESVAVALFRAEFPFAPEQPMGDGTTKLIMSAAQKKWAMALADVAIAECVRLSAPTVRWPREFSCPFDCLPLAEIVFSRPEADRDIYLLNIRFEPRGK